jgi:Zn-dependent metalloprotease
VKRLGIALAAVTAFVASGGALSLPAGLQSQAAAAGPALNALALAAPSPQQQAQAVQAAQRSLTTHRAAVRGTSSDAFTVRSVMVDRDGSSHVRFDRTFKGLRVVGADVVVHSAPGGAFRGAAAAIAAPISVPTTARIPARTAAATANRAFRGTRSATGTPQLVVDTTGNAGRTQRLAWETVVRGVRADQTPSELHVFVDAATGQVIRSADRVRTGTGNSIFAGQVAISTKRVGSGFQLTDPTRGNADTTDLNQGTSGTGRTFTDADDVWGNGSTADRASAAVDAHYGAMMTFDYYKNVHGRNGIKDNGQGARSRVHYGNNYVNAFWDGTQMTYGDGANNRNPLVALDVAGHEMSHGVTENTANLDYSGDAGGLNEATSDIFGTLVEFYANNPADRPDYDIGEKINIRGDGKPLRYMYNPRLDGRSDNCWSSGTKNQDPHQASSVGNHFFYLLAVGSAGGGGFPTSPTCDNSSVTGIGNDKAGKIWYRALSTYMVSSETYAQARQDTLKAAKDLFGCGTEYAAVQAAWSAVNVSGTDSCGTDPGPGRKFENTTPVSIPDNGEAVRSPITVTGIPGNAPSALKVAVEIDHTYRGDLVVDLIAPGGRVYNLHNRAGGGADDIRTTYTVNASRDVANGTWNLRVRDVADEDVGTIEKWSLQF